ncbi:hypothetical protein B0J12DRAFT_734942 [Macrophomina phaseolina]|uniref:Uncharacterized protein n=1 Tax=Macrophomina phaseolina TaxID=35725 RepID=A0ABQ8GZ49_9PEZI|nr:hypothetical protein B0J12DRAFT_734942 [Macrophomina phaseolina]
MRKAFIDNKNKCNDNVVLFNEAIMLGDKAARLLDYNNHAEDGHRFHDRLMLEKDYQLD